MCTSGAVISTQDDGPGPKEPKVKEERLSSAENESEYDPLSRVPGNGQEFRGANLSADRSWDSYEYDPLDLNYEALKHIASNYLPGEHGNCVDVKTLRRGSFHEIRLLEFEDGWTCIGRFTRDREEPLSVMESEIATTKYVREHTTIPVPEVYFVNFDPSHPVGASFTLMERMQGSSLYKYWYKITIRQQMEVMKQVIDVIAQLSALKFDKIGSLNMSGTVGPLQSMAVPKREGCGPFSNTEDYLFSFIPENGIHTPDVKDLYAGIKKMFIKELEEQSDDPLYIPPYRLIHGDFNGQNLLFTWPDQSQAPKLSGIIDWDYSYVGPLCQLFEYPIFIQDVDLRPHLYPSNKIVRKNFVQTLAQKFPKGSVDRQDVREAFRQKTYGWRSFISIYMRPHLLADAKQEMFWAKHYTDGLRGLGDHYAKAYGGKIDYETDSELESEEDV